MPVGNTITFVFLHGWQVEVCEEAWCMVIPMSMAFFLPMDWFIRTTSMPQCFISWALTTNDSPTVTPVGITVSPMWLAEWYEKFFYNIVDIHGRKFSTG
jgi:hypothetical protein